MAPGARYELTGRVAVSATATVWRARDTTLDRVVAIKALLPGLAGRAELRQRLRDEARVLGSISSPHIVAVYDFVEDDAEVWLVEEWVEGATLRRVRESAGRLTAEQSVGVVRGALTGLATVHALGVVHRDVAPSNILVTLAGESKLVDFGLAAPVGTSGAEGTPAYLSPEAVEGGTLTAASDVYSVAAVLAALLTGADVFTGPTVERVLASHLDPERPGLNELPPALRALLSQSLSIAAADRPADAGTLLALLDKAAERDLGAGWLARAGVAGLVSTAVGTVGLSGARRVTRRSPGRRSALHALSAKPAIAVVAVVAVGAAATAIAVAHASGSSHTAAPVATTTAAPPAAITTQAIATAAAAPTSAALVLASATPSAAASVAASAAAVVPSAALPTAAGAAGAAGDAITATGTVTYQLGTFEMGNDRVPCIELKTADETYFLDINLPSKYTHAFNNLTPTTIDPRLTGLSVGETAYRQAPRWPVGARIVVKGALENYQSDDLSGCPLHRGIAITTVASAG